MTAPFIIRLDKDAAHNRKPSTNPLEDPLNHGALADFGGLFETFAMIKTWMRNKKRTRQLTPDAHGLVNKPKLKPIVQK